MKKILFILLVMISSVIFTKQIKAQQSYVSLQVFYDQLSPYGQWVDNPNYGYVWIPDAGYGFVPYSTNGQWVFTEYGWTWMSNYNWGWAPFHYGRWDYNNYYGWFWIPDNEWGPSWVIWRRANGYYGWAPMRPGFNINVGFGHGYNSHNDHWVFVSERNFGRSNIHRYQVNRNDHERIIRNSTVINRTYDDRNRNRKYIAGPDRGEVQKATGRRIRTYGVQDHNVPGHEINKGQLKIYRPQIKHNDREQRAAPSRVSNMKDVQRPSERNNNNRQHNINQPENNKRQQQPDRVKSSKQKSNEQHNNKKGEQSKKSKSEKRKKRND